MAGNQGIPNTMGRELSALTSFKSISAAITQARDLSARLMQNTAEIKRMSTSSAEKRRQDGYSSFMSSVNAFRGRIGGNEGKTIDRLIEGATKRISSAGGSNISGKELHSIIGELRAGLRSAGKTLSGDESLHLSRLIKGLGNSQGYARIGGFNGLAGGQKDMVKAAFGMSNFSMLKDVVANFSAEFKNTTALLKDPGLKTALNNIKTGMEKAANAATTSGEKLKALGNAKKDIENLIKSSSGLDKGVLQALQMNIARLDSEIKKANSGRLMQKFGLAISKPFVNAAQTFGQTIGILGSLKRTFDIGNSLFQSINSKINQFGRMQIGITSERAGYWRTVRGAGIEYSDMMGAIAAGRTAGMDDRTVISQMADLQSQLAQARWGEGGLIEAAGRWGLSTYNANGGVKSANEMMIDFSRKLRSLGSDMEKLQFLTHMKFRPDQMEYVENYEKEAKRMEMLKANPHLQTVLDRADILDADGTNAKIDKYTKLEQRRRQIENQNAIQGGLWSGIKRSLHTDNWLFSDWTARQKGVRGAQAEIANEKMMGILSDLLQTVKENGGDRQAALEAAFNSPNMTAETLTGLFDSLKLEAEKRGDPSILRDFESAFEQMTGLTTDTRSNVEKLCDKLNETFSKIVDWAKKAVDKLFGFLGKSPEEKGKTLATAAGWGTAAGVGTALAGSAVVATGAKIASKTAGKGWGIGWLGGKIGSGIGRLGKWGKALSGLVMAGTALSSLFGGKDEDKSTQPEEDQSENDLNQYAEGGKSSRKAIFGEKGPEYAIPVKHTKRTAQLIDNVAQESGFGRPISEEEGLPEYAEGGRYPQKGRVSSLSRDEYYKRLQRRAANRRDRTSEGLQRLNEENDNAFMANLSQGDALLISAGEAAKRVLAGRTLGLSDLAIPSSHNEFMRKIYDENPTLEYLALAGEFGSAIRTGGKAAKAVKAGVNTKSAASAAENVAKGKISAGTYAKLKTKAGTPTGAVSKGSTVGKNIAAVSGAAAVSSAIEIGSEKFGSANVNNGKDNANDRKDVTDKDESKKDKKPSDKQFLGKVRNVIKRANKRGENPDDELKKMFSERGFDTVNLDLFKTKEFLRGGAKGDAYGQNVLRGMALAKENVKASLLAGKGVNVQEQLNNLTDKYGLAWKASGGRFDDPDQRIAIAARQSGAKDVTTFKEMDNYWKNGHKLGEKQVELLGKMYAELAKKDENKGLSPDQIREKAEKEVRKKFLGDMTQQDLKNRFKYDENGKEIKSEADQIKARDAAFAKEGVEVKMKQRFTSEQKASLDEFIAQHADTGKSKGKLINAWAAENDMSYKDALGVHFSGTNPEELKGEDKELFLKTKEGKQWQRKQKHAAQNRDREKEWTEALHNATEEDVKNVLGGPNAEEDADFLIDARNRKEAGIALSENAEKRYNQLFKRYGKRLSSGRVHKKEEPQKEPDFVVGSRERTFEDKSGNDGKENSINSYISKKNPIKTTSKAPREKNKLFINKNPEERGKLFINKNPDERGKLFLTKDPEERGKLSLTSRTPRVSGRRPNARGNAIDKASQTTQAAESAAASGRRAMSDRSRTFANTAEKANAAESAAGMGNMVRSRSGGEGSPQKGGASGGNAFNVSAPITVHIVVNGNLDKDAAKDIEGQLGKAVADRINNALVSVSSHVGTK